jgi:pilus assembly protein CpaB
MSAKKIFPIAIAVVLGLVAVFLVRSYITSAPSQTAAAGLRPVVVAAVPIDRGAPTQASVLKVVQFPADSAPPGAYASISDISGENARLTLRGFAANEPILAAKLAPKGSAPVMSMNLTPGMRAISVKSDEVVGVGGFLVPGDRVDVLVTRSVGDGPNPVTLVQSLAENVSVLGVDQIDETDKPQVAKAITLEVTAEQAQAISLAKAVGAITLTLRQGSDSSVLVKKIMSANDLNPVVAAPKPAAPAPARKSQPSKQSAPSKPAGSEVVVTRGTVAASYTVGRE